MTLSRAAEETGWQHARMYELIYVNNSALSPNCCVIE